MVTQIIDWNRNKRDEVKLDSKIFGSLLLCLASPENLREGLVNDCIMNFIQSIFCIQSKKEGHDLIFPYCFILGCFEVRCRNAVDRISPIHSFKTDILEKIRKMGQIRVEAKQIFTLPERSILAILLPSEIKNIGFDWTVFQVFPSK